VLAKCTRQVRADNAVLLTNKIVRVAEKRRRRPTTEPSRVLQPISGANVTEMRTLKDAADVCNASAGLIRPIIHGFNSTTWAGKATYWKDFLEILSYFCQQS